MSPQPRSKSKTHSTSIRHRRMVIGGGIVLVIGLAVGFWVVYQGLSEDLRIQWARTTPPFVGDLAVAKPRGIVLPRAADAAELLAVIDLDAVREQGATVPTFYLAKIPDDLLEFAESNDQKQLFFKFMLPIVLKVNAEIARLRDRLLFIKNRRNGVLLPEDQEFIDRLGDWYGVKDGDLDELIRRVDAVPPSLALAQALEESGWGMSRFARIANALFGQHAFRPGRPQVPHPVDGTPPIRAFPDLISSISAYMHNLNTHKAYEEFRALRGQARDGGQPLDGNMLAAALVRYSERGEDYIATIQNHIAANRLKQFDKASLAE
ncbi:MAG: hypothetical protein GY791_18760 [Alphaproteobacteria bacterium]|nr:hypothetical protein [Alphaproteobacteria bacterium]